VRFETEIGGFAFLRHSLGSLGATYDDHLRLLQRGPVDPKFQVEGVASTNHSSSQKTRLNDLSCGIKIWTDLFSILSQFTRLMDGQTDGRTAFLSLDRVCIPCIAVKMRKGSKGSKV